MGPNCNHLQRIYVHNTVDEKTDNEATYEQQWSMPLERCAEKTQP